MHPQSAFKHTTLGEQAGDKSTPLNATGKPLGRNRTHYQSCRTEV